MTTQSAEILSIKNIEAKIHYLVGQKRFGDALEVIRHFVESIIFNQRSLAKVFASADLDRLCRYVGELASNTTGVCSIPQSNRSGTVILTTELVKVGGHVEIIKDIIRLKLLGGPISILLTDIFDRVDDDLIAHFSKTYGVPVEVATGCSSNERIESVIKKIWDLAPSTLVLMTHNQDSVGVAAAHSRVADKVIFMHHGDTHLTLGVTCTDFVHVDFTNVCYFHCRENLGLKNNYYWPLSVDIDKLKRKNLSFLKQKYLLTCSSGRQEKFDASLYGYDYCSIIPKLLSVTKGKHIHIGNLSDAMVVKLRHGLSEAGIKQENFIHISSVPSVARALIEHGVDLYISSFPIGGGKATIEAMAASTPLLMHQNYFSRFHGGVDIAYPDAWVWKTEAEFLAIVSDINVDDLRRHSALARMHYEKFYSDKVLLDAADFSKPQDMDQIPKLRPYLKDELQEFIYESAAISTLQNNYEKEIERINGEWFIAISEVERITNTFETTAKERDALHYENAELYRELNSPKALFKAFLKLFARPKI